MSPHLLAAVALGLTAMLASRVQAQSATGSATASATVISPLVLAVTNHLNFGRLARGSSRSVPTNGSANGRFYVAGQGAHSVSVTLTLPATLRKASDDLAIGSWTGTSDTFDWNNMAGYSPVSGTPVTRTLPGTVSEMDKRVYFRLGGTVTAGALQPLGIYSGTVTVTAAYSGI